MTIINRQTIAGALVAVGALGGTAGVIGTVELFRFWAPRGEFEAVAVRVYEMTADRADFQHRRAEAALRICNEKEDARCWSEERDLRDAAEDLAIERARYKRYKGE
jgi:hypothetical protein